MVVAILAWNRPALWMFLPAVSASGVYAWRAANLRLPGSISALRWQVDGRWRWQSRDGGVGQGRCIAARVHGDHWVSLTLRADHWRWRRVTCTLFSDALDPATHRRLRARLRITPPVSKCHNGR